MVPKVKHTRCLPCQRQGHHTRTWKEADQARAQKQLSAGPLSGDVEVAGQHNPVPLITQCWDPFFISDVGQAEFISMTDDLVIAPKEDVYASRKVGR